MLTAVNCFLLWGLTWLQFVISLGNFSYRGTNLWFYVVEGEPLGMTIPETFLAFSIALSIFAVGAVVGGTRSEPRLWKRILAVGIFAAIAVGMSCMNVHLRHYSHGQAMKFRAAAMEDYHRNLTMKYDSTDPWDVEWLEWQRRVVDGYDRDLDLYQERYGSNEPR